MGDPISDALHRLFPLTGPQARVIAHPTEADLVALETELGVQSTGARRGSTPKPKSGGDRAARSRAARAAGRGTRPAAPRPAQRAAGQARSPAAGRPAARQPAARQAARQPAARQAARQPAARQAARQPAHDAETMRKLQQYRATLGDINRVPRARQATPAQLQKLDGHARALLARVNGRQSFADLIASCGLPELHATYYFALLVTHRIIR